MLERWQPYRLIPNRKEFLQLLTRRGLLTEAPQGEGGGTQIHIELIEGEYSKGTNPMGGVYSMGPNPQRLLTGA